MHSGYKKGSYQNDVALIKLTYPFKFNEYVKAIAMPDPSSSYEKLDCSLSGWGLTTSGILIITNYCGLSAYNSSILMPWVIILFIYPSWSTLPNDEPKQQTKSFTNKY